MSIDDVKKDGIKEDRVFRGKKKHTSEVFQLMGTANTEMIVPFASGMPFTVIKATFDVLTI